MKILVDMNLSPEWISVFSKRGWEAVHWSTIGSASAPDHEILQWAKNADHIVFTLDLDFGAILAATQGKGPSVMQVRVQDVDPGHIGDMVCKSFRMYETYLRQGALVTVDHGKARVRVLPLS